MNYEVNIDKFSGPLDLLLHLIKESKVNIYDIKIVDIKNQYLKNIKKMQNLNLDIQSDYLVMASELIEMKSRMLLPKPEIIEEDEIDPREKLINRLIEYQKYKDMIENFKNLEKERKQFYTKSPEKISTYSDNSVCINEDLSVNDLMNELMKFIQRKELEKPLNTTVTKKEISVEERRNDIKKILSQKKKVNFFDLFDNYTREYIVVTFLAILEMAKKQELMIYQENNFENIICEVK